MGEPTAKVRGDRTAERQRRRAYLEGLRQAYRCGVYVAGTAKREGNCEGCGNLFPFWRDHHMRFCSRVCSGRDLPTDVANERRRRRHRISKLRWRRRQADLRRRWFECDGCGERALTTHASKRYCSAACQRLVLVREKPLIPRMCASCGEVFTPTYADKRRRYCSDNCSKRAFGRKHRHRARRYGVEYEPVNRVRLFERDAWRCQICGVSTPRRLMGTVDPRAPEMDHRIPMAAPHCGSHTWANVQCACRACNLAKGAKAVLGQGNLFPKP